MKNHTQPTLLEMREEQPKARGSLRRMSTRKNRREDKQKMSHFFERHPAIKGR